MLSNNSNHKWSSSSLSSFTSSLSLWVSGCRTEASISRVKMSLISVVQDAVQLRSVGVRPMLIRLLEATRVCSKEKIRLRKPVICRINMRTLPVVDLPVEAPAVQLPLMVLQQVELQLLLLLMVLQLVELQLHPRLIAPLQLMELPLNHRPIAPLQLMELLLMEAAVEPPLQAQPTEHQQTPTPIRMVLRLMEMEHQLTLMELAATQLLLAQTMVLQLTLILMELHLTLTKEPQPTIIPPITQTGTTIPLPTTTPQDTNVCPNASSNDSTQKIP